MVGTPHTDSGGCTVLQTGKNYAMFGKHALTKIDGKPIVTNQFEGNL